MAYLLHFITYILCYSVYTYNLKINSISPVLQYELEPTNFLARASCDIAPSLIKM